MWSTSMNSFLLLWHEPWVIVHTTQNGESNLQPDIKCSFVWVLVWLFQPLIFRIRWNLCVLWCGKTWLTWLRAEEFSSRPGHRCHHTWGYMTFVSLPFQIITSPTFLDLGWDMLSDISWRIHVFVARRRRMCEPLGISFFHSNTFCLWVWVCLSEIEKEN